MTRISTSESVACRTVARSPVVTRRLLEILPQVDATVPDGMALHATNLVEAEPRVEARRLKAVRGQNDLRCASRARLRLGGPHQSSSDACSAPLRVDPEELDLVGFFFGFFF